MISLQTVMKQKMCQLRVNAGQPAFAISHLPCVFCAETLVLLHPNGIKTNLMEVYLHTVIINAIVLVQ